MDCARALGGAPTSAECFAEMRPGAQVPRPSQ